MTSTRRIKVTSRSFSRHPVLKKELETLFPNSVFNQDGPETGLPDLEHFLADADGLILGLEKMDRSLLGRLKNLKIIAKYGVGLDNVDLEAAVEYGIQVGWTGGVNKRSVSEQTLGFMLGLTRDLFRSGFELKTGSWDKQGGSQLTGKCVGIIGCGNIGTDLIHLLQPFAVKILINDVVDKQGVVDTYGIKQVPKDELLTESDFVSLHVPLTDQTFHMVNEDFLRSMKPSSFLINTSRGSVIDQSSLKKFLQDGLIAGSALDVFESEPPDDIEFLQLPNLMITPHIGGNAEEAVLAMGRSALKHIKNYFLV